MKRMRRLRFLFPFSQNSSRSDHPSPDLQFEKCEPRQMLSTVWQTGPLNSGVASSNNAQGLGYMMFSEESALTRFQGNNTNNAEHFVPVRFRNDGQWQYNNNRGWVNFSARSSDVLVAQLNFSLNTATSLENVNTRVAGVQAGYDFGDIIVQAGKWKGLDRPDEFTVVGSTFTTFVSAEDTIEAGDLGRGVAVEDLTTGTGYLMYTEQPFNERFPFTNVNQAEHFVAIRRGPSLTTWEYSNNREWLPFATIETDLIVAELDFADDSVELWKGIKYQVQKQGSSIDGGFVDGDITIVGGQWNGKADIGEFQVFGSYLRRYDKNSISFSVANLNDGVAITDNATGTGYLLYSQQLLTERFEDIPTGNAANFIAVRHDGQQWQYNNDQAWVAFDPVQSDFLVATVDFDTDRIVSLESSATSIEGITVGFIEGDLTFAADQFGNQVDDGEIQVRGTFVKPWVRESTGDLGRGIWVHDEANEDGFLMHSQQPVQRRFDWVNAKSSQNFIAVMNDGLDWYYSNGFDWVSFVPAPSDRIVAKISFQADGDHSIRMLASSDSDFEGMMANYEYGDLNFLPNTWNGKPFPGRVSVVGTHFLTEPGVPNSAFESPIAELADGIFRQANAFGGTLPKQAIYSADGQPLLSWRVAILPYIGHDELFNKFDKQAAWDSPQNLALLDEMPSIYVNPEFTFRNKTTYQVLVGDNTAFPIDTETNVPLALLGETILVVETDADRAVEWTRPLDLAFSSDDPLDGLGGGFSNQFDVALATRAISSSQLPSNHVYSIPAQEDGGNFTLMAERGTAQPNLDSIQPFAEIEHNLRAIGLATNNYHAAFKQLPSWSTGDDTPLLSWRVMILPFLGYNDLYQQFNLQEAWDSPNNLALLDQMPRVFNAPELRTGNTTVLGTVGLGESTTVFPLDRSRVTLETIQDGADRTVMFLESSLPVAWTEPRELAATDSIQRTGWGRSRQHGTNVVMANGQTQFVGNEVSDADVSSLVFTDDGQHVDFALYANYGDPVQNLRASALAANNFHDAFRRLPAYAWFEQPFNGGQPLLSWRVSILPFLGYNELYDQFNLNEAWDSPNNIALLPLMPREFAHPLVTGQGMTNFRAVVGEAPQPTPFSTVFPSDARKVTLEAIPDGASNTALFVEANADQAVEWTRPLGLAYSDANPWQGLGTIEGAGFNVATADAGTRFVSSETSAQRLRDLLLMNNGA